MTECLAQTRRLFAFWCFLFALLTQLNAFAADKPPQYGSTDPKAIPEQPWLYYALLIGNDDYEFLPRLQTPADDARSMARVLREEYGFNTTVLLNATRSDIYDALVTYRKKLPVNSSLLIYYAGHGVNDAEAKIAYWLPVDARSTSKANWISAEDITGELRVIKATHVLVIADSCYSGALMRGLDGIDLNAELKPEERKYYLEKLQAIKSRDVMASGGNEPVADGGGDGHSIFAAVLLQSLRDLEGGQFTAGSLFQKLAVRVAGRSQQTPQYSAVVNSGHDGGDFIFTRQPGKTPPPDVCCSSPASSGEAAMKGNNARGGESFATESIETLLSRYRNAYENEDLADLQRIWPSIKPDQLRNLQAVFRQARSLQLHTTMVGEPVIDDKGATLTLIQDLSFVIDGKPTRLPPTKIVMRLVKQTAGAVSAGWKIDSLR